MSTSPSSLTGVLDRIEKAAKAGGQLSLDDVLDAVGRRSFGPLLIVAGLVILAPVVGDIPGMPTAVGVFVLLVTSQIVFGREHIWLPRFLLDRSIAGRRLTSPLGWLRRPARVVDHLFRPRLDVLARSDVATRAIAGICLAVSAVMPALELIPFSANAAGLVLVVFGTALLVRDGVMVIVGAVATVATLVIVGIAIL